MYEHNVIMACYILSNCYFIFVTEHETTKSVVTVPISVSWVKNQLMRIIAVGSCCPSGLMSPQAFLVHLVKVKIDT